MNGCVIYAVKEGWIAMSKHDMPKAALGSTPARAVYNLGAVLGEGGQREAIVIRSDGEGGLILEPEPDER